ncbi:hypothetical protein [Lentibacillus salicampi]|uniref:hypothetical protein n=1 Tax=Lentibacillus salicampi TaxID=175306 RepID=UPI001ADD8470|nr:hypothetical protein [Lentibacillus salicampi]
MITIIFTQRELDDWKQQNPILKDITDLNPVFWMNPNLKKVSEASLPLTRDDMEEAELLWQRFAPFLKNEFPETNETNGVIESPLRQISHMKKNDLPMMAGEFYLKCDHELPIAGSVKARSLGQKYFKKSRFISLQPIFM